MGTITAIFISLATLFVQPSTNYSGATNTGIEQSNPQNITVGDVQGM